MIKTVIFDMFETLVTHFESPVYMSCEDGIKKPNVEIFQRCMRDLSVEPEECLYIGDGGTFELETAQFLGMYPIQAAWYLKDGVNQPAKRKREFLQAESPLEVILEINKYKK